MYWYLQTLTDLFLSVFLFSNCKFFGRYLPLFFHPWHSEHIHTQDVCMYCIRNSVVITVCWTWIILRCNSFFPSPPLCSLPLSFFVSLMFIDIYRYFFTQWSQTQSLYHREKAQFPLFNHSLVRKHTLNPASSQLCPNPLLLLFVLVILKMSSHSLLILVHTPFLPSTVVLQLIKLDFRVRGTPVFFSNRWLKWVAWQQKVSTWLSEKVCK